VRTSLEVPFGCRVLCVDGVRGLSGSRGASRPPFPASARRWLHRPSPGPFESGSFPRASWPLRSLLAYLPCAPFRRCPALGFLPSSRRHRRCLLLAGLPTVPLRSVLRFSQPLDGFLHLRLCRLVSSRCHVQGFRPGVWSRPAAVPARRRPCLLALVDSALTGCPAATHSRLSFEALIHGAGRSSESAVNLLRCRSPLRLCLLQAPSSASRLHTITVQWLRS